MPVEYIASNGNTVFFATTGLKVFGSDFTNITSFQQITQAGGFSDVTIDNLTLAAVPEPGSLALLIGMTMTGAGFLSRRRQVRNAL